MQTTVLLAEPQSSAYLHVEARARGRSDKGQEKALGVMNLSIIFILVTVSWVYANVKLIKVYTINTRSLL